MSLKSLIQRLLDSRTTPAQAAHNAAPGLGDISINGTEYICPSDGYVTALANGAAAGGFNLNLKRNGLNVQGGPQTIQFAEWVQARMIPVAKGDKVTLELYNQNLWEWRFIPAIGGEGWYLRSFVSAVCKRGELCLSRLSLCLPRSSFRTNLSGSATKQCRSLTQQTKLNSHRQISTLSTLRQVMATSPCTRETTRGLNCTTETELSLVLHPAQRTVIYKWPQLRVQELTTWLATRMEALQKSLFPLLQQSERNALTGGALC